MLGLGGVTTVRPAPRRAGWIGLTIVITVIVAALPGRVGAVTPLTVAQAISQQGSAQTVRGYVVGQPTASSTVVRSGFPNDYAIALADAPGETDTADMLYVQVSSAYRSAWGLRTNPDLLGDRIDVSGSLGPYFSHPGLTSPTGFAVAGGTTPDPEPTNPTPTDPGDYYADASGLSGAALESALHDIISTQTKISYDAVWDALKVTDQDPGNSANVLLFYSGQSRSKSANGGSVGQWNREHVWPQSHGSFGTSTGPGTDLHHLRPTDVQVNSTRGNKDFDEGGSTVSGCSACLTDGDSFEPPDAVKGDVARMVMYMSVRYEGGDGFADLEANDQVNGSTPYLGRISVLLDWHAQDPPSAFEQRRNDVIDDQFQGNRNPFIDHPEWAASVFG